MAQFTIADIEENFRFAVLEVTSQVEDTLRALENPSEAVLRKIRSRDDYIDNLKSIIENKSFTRLAGAAESDRRTLNTMRAMVIITNNLEKIADYAVNIANQLQYYDDPAFIRRFNYHAFFDRLMGAFDALAGALYGQDMNLALQVCRAELELDRVYRENLRRIIEELKTGQQVGALVTTLFIFGYLERMGDAMLNIGEAIIFSIMGEKIKISEYRALEDTLESTGGGVAPLPAQDYQGIWGTRSGCRIGALNQRGAHSARNAIFKHGQIAKLAAERDNISAWEALIPGLAPRALAFHDEGDTGSLLLEYIEGITMQEILLNAAPDLFEAATGALLTRAPEIWAATRREEPAQARFVAQTRERLDAVYRLHPGFRGAQTRIGGLVEPSVDELLALASLAEARLAAPFSVFIHGDFNVNNIIFNPAGGAVRFIDLHRSRYGDYAQDVAVFIVSNFRLPVFDRAARARLNHAMLSFYEAARGFAQTQGDPHFTARAALGLARSFITSTRFEFRPEFAKKMFLRGRYLLGRVGGHAEREWETFNLPPESFLY